jgi:4-amino-4-deoxy-L-arabinose transferase-like glycosyltransferase
MRFALKDPRPARSRLPQRPTLNAQRFFRKLSPRTLLGLGALVAVALGLRAWGLGWGLPDGTRYYPYHPDESVLLHAVCSVNPLRGDFRSGFYSYGSLYIFLSRLAYDLLAPLFGWGTLPRFHQPFGVWVGDFARLLLVGRWLTLLMGVGTVLAVYGLARQLFGSRAGWLAAGFLVVAPLPVMLGHYMTVDVPATFFTTLSLLLSAAALRAPEPRRARWLIVGAGLAAGLATGTKYNSFPALFAAGVPLWALARRHGFSRQEVAVPAGGTILACAGAFLLSTPGVLLEFTKFRMDLLYEMALNQKGHGFIFQATPPAVLYHLGISLPIGLEWPLYLLCLAGLVWSCRKRTPEDWLLLLFLLPSFLLLAPAERKFVRYVTPLVPPLLVLAARCVDEGLAGRGGRWWGIWAGAAAGAALASTVAHLGVLSAPDARDQAAAYLRAYTKSTEWVALGGDAWYYTPPVHPTTGCVKVAGPYGGPPIWDAIQPGRPRPDLCWVGTDQRNRYWVLAPPSYPEPWGALPVTILREFRPRTVIVTDYEYEDPLRIRRAHPSFKHGTLELLAAMKQGYQLEKEFRPRPSLFGFTWWRSGIPPHDWRYYMPTVRLYGRVD